MPIYEYRCNQCEREFEKYVQGTQAAVECPECRSARVTRRLSVVGVRTGAGSGAPASMAGGGGCCGGGCGCH